MSISTRYRTLAGDTRTLLEKIQATAPNLQDHVLRELAKASETLESLSEQVGEIPQFKLEKELTPVLLKVHGALDRGRLQLEESSDATNAGRVWELEQQIYRLLNDL